MAHETINAECAIAGGGPAGVMLGFLLARAGVSLSSKSTTIFSGIFAAIPSIHPR